jgi:hypothetical protein
MRRGTRRATSATRRQFSRPNRLEVEPSDETVGDDGMGTKLSISKAYIEDCGGVIGLVAILVGIVICTVFAIAIYFGLCLMMDQTRLEQISLFYSVTRSFLWYFRTQLSYPYPNLKPETVNGHPLLSWSMPFLASNVSRFSAFGIQHTYFIDLSRATSSHRPHCVKFLSRACHEPDVCFKKVLARRPREFES